MHVQHFFIRERELSIYLTVVVLILGAFLRSRLITKGFYTRVTYLHIAVPTITRPYATRNPAVKNRETHGRIVSLHHLGESKSNCWSHRHVYRLDELKSFKNSSTSVSKLAIVLIWSIPSPHEDNLSSCERYKIITSKALGTMHAQHFLIAQRERSIYDSCRFDIGRSCASRLITKYVYNPEWHICIS